MCIRDSLDVFVVDLNALDPIHVLNFLDQIGRQFLHAEQPQDVVRVEFAVGDDFTLFDVFAIEHADMPPFRNQLFVKDFTVLVADDQPLLALGFLAEFDDAGFLGQNRGFLGLAGFEQVRHSWQTAGDIASLGGFLWDAGDHVAHRCV